MKWYDLIAPFYDSAGTARYYRPMRQEAVCQLRLAPGQTVLDVACGTGLNFELILGEIGSRGILVGTDYSAGMLDKARQRVKRQGWQNRVYLIQADARRLAWDMLKAALPAGVMQIDRVLCTLGLSVVPDWKLVFERSFDLLAPGGRYAAMDAYFEQSGLRTKIVNAIANSDVSRRFWEPLQERGVAYEEAAFPFLFGGRILVVSATRPHPI